MAHHHHHHHRIKSISPPLTKASQIELDPKNYHLFRVVVLLLLMLSVGVSILRMANSSSSLSIQSSDTFLIETSKDLESLKTHISSNKNHLQVDEEKGADTKPQVSCSSLIDGSSSSSYEGLLCCDRSHYRTDVCYMRGDIRTKYQSSSILLYGKSTSTAEKIRPYTRKWETEVMNTIDEITLHRINYHNNKSDHRRCDVRHEVPAIVFSTGGYTGNVYHEFNEGLIPLYITAQRFEGEVVLVVSEYHSWWKTKYGKIVEKLSNYKMVDLSNDGRVHCFSEMIVGLKIHGELTIDPNLMPNGKGIQDFQSLVSQGFGFNQPNNVQSSLQLLPHSPDHSKSPKRPKLAIFIRNKSRVLQNLREVIKLCRRIGFDVLILNPRRTTPMSDIYAALDSAHAMLAVHGAAMTHFLFMRPGSVLIQIVPLGLDWAADSYYGEPARKLGLEYMIYKVAAEESSLYKEYDHRNPVLTNPNAVSNKGWSETKRIYLDRQNVRVHLKRFSKLVTKAHNHITNKLQERM